MKIDAATIDHNVLELIRELNLWDVSGAPEIQHMCIGYIQGMEELAERLKEVLRA